MWVVPQFGLDDVAGEYTRARIILSVSISDNDSVALLLPVYCPIVA